jgi:hypothetical protein
LDGDGQLIVGLNEWYRLMQGVGAVRTRETYMAVLRPWCSAEQTADKKRRRTRKRRTRASDSEPCASYDRLQRLDKRDLVQRIRALERELDAERRQRGALAYDQQALRSKLLRMETEIDLLQAERSPGG